MILEQQAPAFGCAAEIEGDTRPRLFQLFEDRAR